MLIKRPHINTEAERNAKFDIQELIAFERFCRDNGQWYIKGFTSIYDKDSMMPVIPNNEVTFPTSALDGLRESYACLAYTGINSGRSINNELPGRDHPDLVEEIYNELENWLYEKER